MTNNELLAELSDNNSGRGKTSHIPDELRGLNWGAFFLTFIWGISMRVPQAWLSLIPFVGELMRIVLLIKGNEWAWQRRRWYSADHFRKTQSWWTKFGIILNIAMFLISIFVADKMVDMLYTSPYLEAYLVEYQKIIFRLFDFYH